MILTVIFNNPVAAQTSTGIVITKLNLKSTLDNLGYETVDLGSDTYQIKLVQGASVPISVVLSADGSRSGLITNLGNKILSNLSSEVDQDASVKSRYRHFILRYQRQQA